MFSFEKERDIWDVEKLMQDVRELETEQIKAISNYLSAELCNKYYSVKETQASEVDTIIDLIEYISQHRKVKKPCETTVDPEYKIYKRFRDFADRLIAEYTTLYTIYGEALKIVMKRWGSMRHKTLLLCSICRISAYNFWKKSRIIRFFALNKLVTYFETKLSANGKKYDRSAIKFYLVNEMIKCRVFPNERSEYDAGK